jgi:diguanylate cyclase (GGDEF)-like protein/PAS domain S-box-containing protein
MLSFFDSNKSNPWFHTTQITHDQVGQTIDQWHERALQRLLLAILRLGAIAAIPISTLAVMQGAWFVPLADVIALGFLWLLYRQQHWTYRVRANTLMALIYVFSVWLFFSSGTSGLLFLLACPMMAALLLGGRAAAAAVAVCSLTALVVGYTADHLYPMSTLKDHFDAMRVWLVTLNFSFVASVVADTTHLMLNGLGSALGREQLVVQNLRLERERLAATNADLRLADAALARLHDLVLITDNTPVQGQAGAIVYINDTALSLSGYQRDEILGQPPHIFHGPDTSQSILAALAQAQQALHPFHAEIRLYRKSGEPRWMEQTVTPLLDAQGYCTHFVHVQHDITDRMAAQTQLHQMGYYDTLTGLPNRRRLIENIEAAQREARSSHTATALVYLDLDQFRTLNEAKGTSSGDELLCQVAHLLRTMADAGSTVARLGGDEFGLLMTGLPTEEYPLIKASTARVEAIRQRLQAPLVVAGEPFRASVSLGVTVFADDARIADDLIQEAEIAMYRAKKGGRNSMAFFAPAMQSEVQLRLSKERDLETALAQGQFQMYAQSQVQTDGRLAGAELLMRWQHPTRGKISPSEFIGLAEDNGLIVPMGLWALGQGCAALARLQRAGQAINLSVNVSVRQFGQDSFVNDVQTILAASGADPSHLVLEVTESLLIQQPEAVVARMHELAKLGVRFSIDDFGTGYSSLAYLQRLPLYELKIDRGFVRDAPQHAGDAAITRLIISMAKHLGLKVVAEGVETPEQAQFLADNGCDVLQGFMYAHPLPLEEWLANTCTTGNKVIKNSS